MILSRRGFLSGLGAALAAPAIVKVASLMPIKAPALWTNVRYGQSFIITDEELMERGLGLAQVQELGAPVVYSRMFDADAIIARAGQLYSVGYDQYRKVFQELT